MLDRKSIDILYNLAEYVNDDMKIDWKIILNKTNQLTDILLSLSPVDMSEDKSYDLVLTGIKSVSFGSNKHKCRKFVSLITKNKKKYNIEVDLNLIVKYLL